MEVIRQKHGDDKIHEALNICNQAVAVGNLVPTDAYDIAHSLATLGSTEDQAPRSIAELAVLAEAIRIVPITEA